ncbi:MAG: alpha/beta hydrolase [Lawsonibacter sp.]|nr:alpha/beta hydrolase [Lawsonibacter sp.]
MIKYNLHPSFRDWNKPGENKKVAQYVPPEELEVIYDKISVPDPEREIEVKIFRPKNVGPEKLPIIMDVHGGGFVSGSYENDNNRVTNLALNVPSIVVALNYRLAPEYRFPEPLKDCLAVWNWLYENAAEKLGGDPERMGLYGTSAGGCLCAGMAFYIRDHGGPEIKLNVLNTPVLGLEPLLSAEQMRYDAPIVSGHKLADKVRLYCRDLNGQLPSYYAVPNVALDYSELPPTMVIAAEYDPLRDQSMQYVQNLQKDAIPVEFYLMPRCIHGFNAKACDVTEWIGQGVVMSFRREFGISVN